MRNPTDVPAVLRARSADGSEIAFERFGEGPVVMLVGALFDRADRWCGIGLARPLAADLTVIAYDRRGRGDSRTTMQSSVKREVEDIAAIIQAAGGSAGSLRLMVWWCAGAEGSRGRALYHADRHLHRCIESQQGNHRNV
jgi:pimeloyl-ACP methyl ester carboxylesterase